MLSCGLLLVEGMSNSWWYNLIRSVKTAILPVKLARLLELVLLVRSLLTIIEHVEGDVGCIILLAQGWDLLLVAL